MAAQGGRAAQHGKAGQLKARQCSGRKGKAGKCKAKQDNSELNILIMVKAIVVFF